jgi:hypothetical protein
VDALDFGNPPSFVSSTRVVAVSRTDQDLEPFALDNDSNVWTATWIDFTNWTAWEIISTIMTFPAGSQLATVSRTKQTLDVLINDNGTIMESH